MTRQDYLLHLKVNNKIYLTVRLCRITDSALPADFQESIHSYRSSALLHYLPALQIVPKSEILKQLPFVSASQNTAEWCCNLR